MQDFWKKRGNSIFFGILFLGYLAVTLFLFHRQTVGYGGRYVSDMPSYLLEVQGISSGYDFPYPVMFWIARFLDLFTTTEHALALTVTGLNGLTALVLKVYFDKYLEVRKKGPWKGCLSTLLLFSVLMASMLYPLHYLGRYHDAAEEFLYRYRGVFTPNPWHNATFLAARPFSAAAFFLCVDILGDYEKEDRWLTKRKLAFSALLLAATMTKPSFTLVLSAVCGMIMLWRLMRDRFRGWKAFLQFGITFLPAFADLLYQYRGVFVGQITEEESKGIGFGFLSAWKMLTDNVPMAILLATTFPLAVLLFRRLKVRQEPGLLFAWQFWGVSLVMLAVLYEKGYRMQHVNFAWGYMYGLFFLYVTSLLALARETGRGGQPRWQLGIQWALFAVHMVCGLDYFRVMLGGGLFS